MKMMSLFISGLLSLLVFCSHASAISFGTATAELFNLQGNLFSTENFTWHETPVNNSNVMLWAGESSANDELVGSVSRENPSIINPSSPSGIVGTYITAGYTDVVDNWGGKVFATSTASSNGIGFVGAQSNAAFIWNFSPTSTGSSSFSVDFNRSFSSSSVDGYVNVYSGFYINLINNTRNTVVSTNNTSQNDLTGTLSLGLDFSSGERGALVLIARTDVFAFEEIRENPGAPIPEPTTMLLFGAGLAGLAAAGRRRKS